MTIQFHGETDSHNDGGVVVVELLRASKKPSTGLCRKRESAASTLPPTYLTLGTVDEDLKVSDSAEPTVPCPPGPERSKSAERQCVPCANDLLAPRYRCQGPGWHRYNCEKEGMMCSSEGICIYARCCVLRYWL